MLASCGEGEDEESDLLLEIGWMNKICRKQTRVLKIETV